MQELFKDRFSESAMEYSLHRPRYPEALFSYLVSLVTERDAAWDCATGNGQSAVSLAKYFKQVYATDASAAQIDHAVQQGNNIHYAVCTAQNTDFPDNCFNLITVAQAIHWFAGERFYREVRRVARKNCIIAAWAYHLPLITPETDRLILRLYSDILAGFWEKEIMHIQSGYRDLFFPFPTISSPQFTMTTEWSFHKMIGYLETWSALTVYEKDRGHNPLDSITPELLETWGDPLSLKKVAWPIMLKTGRIP